MNSPREVRDTYRNANRIFAGSAAAEVESYLRALYRDPLIDFRWHDGSGTDARVVLSFVADRYGQRGRCTIKADTLSKAMRCFEAVTNPWSEAEQGDPECPGSLTWEVQP